MKLEISNVCMKNKIILVTGGSGFIGANLARKLVENNKIHLLIRSNSNLWRLKGLQDKFFLHYHNLLHLPSLKKIVKIIKPQIIYHLAAYGNSSYHNDIRQIIDTNIVGTNNLLLALQNETFECFINTGTSSEYGFKNKPMSERDILDPVSFYAASKAASTYLTNVYGRHFKKPVVTFRPFSVYGPYEDPRRLIPTIITGIIKKQPIHLTPQTARRDFIYIEDVIDFLVHLPVWMKKITPGEVFNLGTGIQTSNEQIVKIIVKFLAKRLFAIDRKYSNRSWDTTIWVADMTHTLKILNWKARYDIVNGLKTTIDWFMSYPDLEKNYVDAIT